MPIDLADENIEIILAEDDAFAQEVFVDIFEEQSWATPCVSADGVEALEQIKAKEFDILVTDLNMPRMGGHELISKALEVHPDLSIIVITGNATVDSAVELMKAGVYDYLTKPYTIDQLLVCLQKAREHVIHRQEIKGIAEIVDALLNALESKDRYLNGHSARVAEYSCKLGKLVGLGRTELHALEYAAKLHDIGKIGIHEDILNKSGPLTDEEYETMKDHSSFSDEIIAPVKFLAPCRDGVRHHHERVDGKGYPDGLKGNEIPLQARIISICDCFDAMTSSRSYRGAMPVAKAASIIEEVAGTQLDEVLTALFLEHLEEITGMPAVVNG